MGTRSLTCVVVDNEYKVAQYCQWDGYPGGQGIMVLNFLKKTDKNIFKEKAKKLTWISQEELEKRWVEAGATPGESLVTFDTAEKFKEKHPENSRDTGALVLTLIQNSDEPLKLVNSLSFAKNSLFCEWAYVIDFDRNKLEVYKGFIRKPLAEDERFFFLQDGSNKEFYPIKLVKEFDLDDLPDEETFIDSIDREVGEEI